MSGMRERLITNSGALDIDSTNGMKVTATLPALSAREAPQLSIVKTADVP